MLRPTIIEDGVKRRERDYFWGKHKGIRAATYGGPPRNEGIWKKNYNEYSTQLKKWEFH